MANKNMKYILALIIAATLAFTASASEQSERAKIGREVRSLFIAEDFRELEKLAEQYRSTLERTPAGMHKIRRFYGGIEETVPAKDASVPAWEQRFGIVDRWAKEFPNSPTPVIARAHLQVQYAWAHRGPGFANAVPDLNIARFRQIAEEAKENLVNDKHKASSDPEYYSILATLNLALGTPNSKYRESLDEGLARFPDYEELYFRAVYYYTPQSHASQAEIAMLAAEAVERTKETRGSELYARIYWAAGRDPSGKYYMFRQPANWSLMREGINDLVARYPDQWNVNHVANFACMKGDWRLAEELLAKVNEPIIDSAWYRRSNYELCKSLVKKYRTVD